MSEARNIPEIYVVNAVPSQETIKVNHIEAYDNSREILIDEYVEVEEKYCGPISGCIGAILFLLFWPASLVVGCCPCDKRVVKKKVVSR